VNVAIAEGLATACARDNFAAHEFWSANPEDLIDNWAADLFAQPLDEPSVRDWKFNHPDGRTFIAHGVGKCWWTPPAPRPVRHPPDLVWVPAQEILSMAKPWPDSNVCSFLE
jgi:hypothetical protein